MSTSVSIRASSLSELFDCPARWEAKHINKKRLPSSGRAQLGKAVHASTALFDNSTLQGLGLTVDETAAAAVDLIHNPGEPVLWEDESPNSIEAIALSLHSKYCNEIAPQQEYQAVEVKCESLHISDLKITLTGTTDRIVKTDDGFGIADIKTGRAVVSPEGIVQTKGHSYQIGIYELLAEHASSLPIDAPAQIIGLTTAKTTDCQRVGIGEIVGARDVLVGTEETPGVLETASTLIHSGVFYGNPKSLMCGPLYCPIYLTCNYRK